MKIIIIGAGQVGSTLTEKLVTEKNELTVIDTDRSLLGILNDKYDLRTVCGLGTHPDILACGSCRRRDACRRVRER